MNTERYKFFRDTQVWPLANDFNYEQWLANFVLATVIVAVIVLLYRYYYL